jgi:Ni,Fe-hydrogenase I cytochrome b subunit
MSQLKKIPHSFRRSRMILRIVMLILILLALREMFVGFVEGLRQASLDKAANVYPTPHAGISLDAMDLSLMLFVVMTGIMISILKEFEAGRYFTESVLRKTFRIGLITEITSYLLLPLLALYQARASGTGVDAASVYFSSINYVGGVAGTFIRYLSRLFLIGKDLEETNELTV